VKGTTRERGLYRSSTTKAKQEQAAVVLNSGLNAVKYGDIVSWMRWLS